MTTFLTLSNARCGSSHLITALDRIPGLRADFEVKWAMFYRPGPVHLPAGPGDNIAALVRQKVAPKAHNNGQVLGSKLVFDPYPRSFIDVDSANSLAEAIDPSVALIHLTRDYFASFTSMFYRGAVHRVTKTLVANDSVLFNDARAKQADLAEPKLSLDPGAVQFTLLNMLHNDLLAMELCRRANYSIQLDYSDIDQRLNEVSEFLGVMVEAETLKAIVSAPTFRKLPVMDLNGLDNINVYRRWTDTLNRARDHYLKQGLPQSRRPLKFVTEGAGKMPRIDISDIVLQKMLKQGN